MGQNSGTSRLSHLGHWLREQLKIEIVVPVIVAAGLLGYVVSIAVAPRSASQLWVVVQQAWLLILVLTFPYLAARLFVWRRLLEQLGLDIPLRPLAASFAVGEMTKSIPAGVYTQNYLLGKLGHFNRISAIRSTVATTATLGLETIVALPVVFLVGVPNVPWIRLALASVVAAWIVIVAVVWVATHYFAAHLNRQRHQWLKRAAIIAAEFLDSGRELFSWKSLVPLVPTAVYMLVYVVDIKIITQALGANISFVHAMVVYAIVILAVVLVPIPTEIGITEFTGLDVLREYGVPGSTAAIVMLSLRLLATGLTIVVAGILLFILRDELERAQKTDHEDRASGEAPAY